MDALELTMKCSKLLQRPYSHSSINDVRSNCDDNKFVNTSFSDNDTDLNRIVIKEDDRISDISKPSRSGTSQSESFETIYIIALPEEMGEVRFNID
jgi:protein required for attachment to host cells